MKLTINEMFNNQVIEVIIQEGVSKFQMMLPRDIYMEFRKAITQPLESEVAAMKELEELKKSE